MDDSSSSPPHAAAPKPPVSRRRMTAARRLVHAITAPVLVALIRLAWWSYRFTVHGDDRARAVADDGCPIVLVFWHENLFTLPWYLSRLTRLGVGVTYLVSPSVDGEYAVRLLDVIGGRAVRGSATRSGTRAIRGLYRVIVKEDGSPVVAADGPRGPSRRCKQGPVVLAQLTGARIVPLAAAARRAVRLTTWDRMPIPLPFTTVAVEVGEPVAVPEGLTDDELESWRCRLEAAINELGDRAAERVSRRPPDR